MTLHDGRVTGGLVNLARIGGGPNEEESLVVQGVTAQSGRGTCVQEEKQLTADECGMVMTSNEGRPATDITADARGNGVEPTASGSGMVVVVTAQHGCGTIERENKGIGKALNAWLGAIVSFEVWQGESQWDRDNAFETDFKSASKWPARKQKLDQGGFRWQTDFSQAKHEDALMLKREEFEHGGVSDVTEKYSTFLTFRFAQGVRGAEFGARGHELKVVLHD